MKLKIFLSAISKMIMISARGICCRSSGADTTILGDENDEAGSVRVLLIQTVQLN